MGFAFINLDETAEPEWQVRVDAIEAFSADGGGVEVILSSGARVYGSLSVPQLMAKMQEAFSRIGDGA